MLVRRIIKMGIAIEVDGVMAWMCKKEKDRERVSSDTRASTARISFLSEKGSFVWSGNLSCLYWFGCYLVGLGTGHIRLMRGWVNK